MLPLQGAQLIPSEAAAAPPKNVSLKTKEMRETGTVDVGTVAVKRCMFEREEGPRASFCVYT